MNTSTYWNHAGRAIGILATTEGDPVATERDESIGKDGFLVHPRTLVDRLFFFFDLKAEIHVACIFGGRLDRPMVPGAKLEFPIVDSGD